MEAPPTKEEYASAFGPISAVRVPHAIHDTMLKAQLHHLGDYIHGNGASAWLPATASLGPGAAPAPRRAYLRNTDAGLGRAVDGGQHKGLKEATWQTEPRMCGPSPTPHP